MNHKILLLPLLLTATLLSQTFNVSTTSELRTALDTAAENAEDDTIILADGKYKTTDDGEGTLIFNGHNIEYDLTLLGSGSKNVILDGSGQDQILNGTYILGTLKLEKLSFTNGNSTSAGGAVYTNSDIEVIDCNFTNNSASSGSGFYSEGSVTVVNSSFVNNVSIAGDATGVFYSGSSWAEDGSSGLGGGFYANGPVSVQNSLFFNNSVTGGKGWNWTGSTDRRDGGKGGDGSGAGFFTNSTAHVINSRFTNNSAIGGDGGYTNGYSCQYEPCDSWDGGDGGNANGAGFYAEGSSIVINSIFDSNSLTNGLGNRGTRASGSVPDGNRGVDGLMQGSAFFSSTVEATNNLLYNNSDLSTTTVDSSALFIKVSVNSRIYNSIFSNNTDFEISGDSTSYITRLEYNYIDISMINIEKDASSNIFDGIELGFTDTGNSNFELRYFSDLINAGTNNPINITMPTTDIIGQDRIFDSFVDIGPYEFIPIKPTINSITYSGIANELSELTFYIDYSLSDGKTITEVAFDYLDNGNFTTVNTHTFNTAGTYTVNAKVTDSEGEFSTASIEIEILPLREMTVNIAPIIAYLLSDTVVATPKEVAINKIKAYADNQENPVPVVQDYTDAGVIGVTAENIDNVNAVITSLTSSDVDSTEEIQAVVDFVIDPQLGDQIILPDGSIRYVDYTGDYRTAPPSAADAEYHTGKGYANTLFDSADNKCMNCHNELYDTWKSSMHGQSWNDPIFQSKFQDFLRTHLAKIGQHPNLDGDLSTTDDGILYQQKDIIDGTGVGTTKNMFSGASQTCIKCHAPGAYYAGDVKVTVTDIGSAAAINNTDLLALKMEHEVNDPQGEISVIAANPHTDRMYKATFQIGHEANREGINCAFCHSIETPRLMKEDGMDMGTYTLAKDMRVGPHGPLKKEAGTNLNYNDDATHTDMNKFFRLWGPEKYAVYHATPKDNFDLNKTVDGRYTMASKDINGTDGKIHFTGGPFYGPYGVTGISNENETDETDRSAHVNPHYDVDGNNHFGESGKGLCLSCHQRSAGAAVPGGEEGAGHFMELCSTQMAVTTGDDVASGDTLSSPKCQKCHMERIDGTVLHQWARPDKLFTLADNPALTGHFDPEDPEGYGDDNPVAAGWLNSHAFLGASKTGQKASVTDKIKSGFEGSVNANIVGDTLTVTTVLSNKTAHMFPGAHPMRRVLTRLIVTDGDGNMLTPTAMTGESTFADATNTLATVAGKTLHASQDTTVTVVENGSANLDFPGKVDDLNGSSVMSQEFDGSLITITGTDATITNQTITNGITTGTVQNAAIVDSGVSNMFTRIYGHETGKKYNNVFVVRPGFDSNMVEKDNRLSPNETETYTLTYDITGKAGVSATYKVYYMQKGANGKFIAATDGWLDQAASDAKRLLVTEVGSYGETP